MNVSVISSVRIISTYLTPQTVLDTLQGKSSTASTIFMIELQKTSVLN